MWRIWHHPHSTTTKREYWNFISFTCTFRCRFVKWIKDMAKNREDTVTIASNLIVMVASCWTIPSPLIYLFPNLFFCFFWLSTVIFRLLESPFDLLSSSPGAIVRRNRKPHKLSSAQTETLTQFTTLSEMSLKRNFEMLLSDYDQPIGVCSILAKSCGKHHNRSVNAYSFILQSKILTENSEGQFSFEGN